MKNSESLELVSDGFVYLRSRQTHTGRTYYWNCRKLHIVEYRLYDPMTNHRVK